MKELRRLQFFIDMSSASKDRWSQVEIERREELRRQINMKTYIEVPK